MPNVAELLNPVSEDQPAGSNLRYDPIYDQIKEARRQEDEIPQGDWARELKKADWKLVVKLCSEVLARRTKDLQLAAWLTEALIWQEGYSGLQQGLELCTGLLEHYWDCLYPEIEDGDMELRASVLDWIGSRLDQPLKSVALTRSGLDWFVYKQSRAIGYEAEIGGSQQKRDLREAAVADGKIVAEEFDKALEKTPKDFCERQMAELGLCQEALEALSKMCDSRFTESAPGFAGLRETLEQVRATVSSLLATKRGAEPDAEPAAEESETEPAGVAEESDASAPSPSRSAAAPARARSKGAVPADRDDAYRLIAGIAAWLRQDDPQNPVPYVLVRAMRWGELRASGSYLDPNLLEPPAHDLRLRLKQLANDGNYEELLAAIEQAAALPCCRGWLDLQRYFCNACDYAGYENAKNAVLAELKLLLNEYPDLPQAMLLDDTPTANAETQRWLESVFPPPAPSAEPAPVAQYELPEEPREREAAQPGEDAPPDGFELAKQAARSGRIEQAIEMLTSEAAQAPSGRARFQRKVQLAQICMGAGREEIAYPILEALSEEIEERKLEGWEAPEMLGHALVLLFHCTGKLRDDPGLKQKLYARICRLDPVQAIGLMK